MAHILVGLTIYVPKQIRNSVINIAVLGLCVVVGVVAFAAVALLVNSPEMKELLGAVRKKE